VGDEIKETSHGIRSATEIYLGRAKFFMDKLKQTQLRDEQHKLREMEMALSRQLINYRL
jgi:hypothetical protein